MRIEEREKRRKNLKAFSSLFYIRLLFEIYLIILICNGCGFAPVSSAVAIVSLRSIFRLDTNVCARFRQAMCVYESTNASYTYEQGFSDFHTLSLLSLYFKK